MPGECNTVEVSAANVSASVPASRIRYRVLLLVCGLSMITYLDRVCFGTAAPLIAEELNLSGVADLKWVFTAFFVSYSVFEIPAGWYGDRLGPRGMLLRIVTWWSLFTIITGMVGWQVGAVTLGGLGTLFVVRFLFGAGEAGAYPNIARVIQNWFPKHQWEMAQGMVWMSGRLAGGVTPLLWAVLVSGTSLSAPLLNWRGAFFLFGGIGLLWCLLFAFTFYNRPDEHPEVNEAERSEIGSAGATGHAGHGNVPWKSLLTNRSVVMLCLMYSMVNYGWAFNITYLPGYLEQRYSIPPSDMLGAMYKGAPLWVGALGCLAGGWFVQAFHRLLGSRSRARQAVGFLAMLVCMCCWIGASRSTSAAGFCFCISLAAFCIDSTLGAAWATCQDLGRSHTAVTAACMNTVGTVGAAVAGWGTGTIVQRFITARAAAVGASVAELSSLEIQQASLTGYHFVFLSYAAVYAFAAAAWLFIDAHKPIAQ